MEVERREISVLTEEHDGPVERVYEIDGGRRVRIDDAFSQPCVRKNDRGRRIKRDRVKESGLDIRWVAAIERGYLRGRELHRVNKAARRWIDEPDVGSHSKAAEIEHVVGGDVRSAVDLAHVNVNILRVTRIAFNRAFTVVIPKLFDEVLLSKETSNLAGEADVSSGCRTAVSRFHADAVVSLFHWHYVVAIRNCSRHGWQKEQAAIGRIEREIGSTAKCARDHRVIGTIDREELSTRNRLIQHA